MTSLSSIVSTANSVIANRPATTKASDELQSLFAKLHMDAIASTTASASSGNHPPPPLVLGLRSVLDGAVSAASAARSVGKLAASYARASALLGSRRSTMRNASSPEGAQPQNPVRAERSRSTSPERDARNTSFDFAQDER